MSELKTKALEDVKRRMEGLEEGTLRYRILESVRNFKTSWIELGQALYSVWKDKLYRGWGYLTFEAYTSKEIGIRKDTAMKLLRSYYFIESEEPRRLRRDPEDNAEVSSLPSYESVNALRLLKDKKGINREDFENLKKDVLENGKDAFQVKRDIAALIRQRDELEPDEARRERKAAAVRRITAVLKNLKNEIRDAKLLPADIVRDIDSLIDRLDAHL